MKDKVLKWFKENYMLVVALLFAIAGCVLCAVFGYKNQLLEQQEVLAQMEKFGFYDKNITLLDSYSTQSYYSGMTGLGVALIFGAAACVCDWVFTLFWTKKKENK